MKSGSLYRLAAFTESPTGGNPAGVWIGDNFPEKSVMQDMAKEVGFSETAFVTPSSGAARKVRYFSPEAEVPFCGHATIASGVQLGLIDGPARYVFDTQSGEVVVDVSRKGKTMQASLISVSTRHKPVEDQRLAAYLELFDWDGGNLNSAIPPVLAYAGAWHLVIALKSRTDLGALQYDFERLKLLMLADGLTTIQVVWQESTTLFHARNPFPVGGVVEDPATGAAAAAFAGYLRDAGLVEVPATLEILQGADMGRPGRLHVEIPAHGGIIVSGSAVSMES